MKQNLLLLSVLLLFSLILHSQNIPLNNFQYNLIENALQQKDVSFFTTVKPILQEDVAKIINLDSVLYPQHQTRFSRTFFGRKLLNKNLIRVDTMGLYLTIDPVFDFTMGRESHSGKNTWTNTRGFTISGRIGKDLSFATDFYENQAVFPDYLDQWVRTQGVVPGQGGIKNFKNDGFDFSNASGYFSYTPSRYFNIQFGHGKNFIGDGYRSLLLSDNSFNYPYLRIVTKVWKLQYTNLYAQFQDRQYPWSQSLGYTKKYGTFHFLNADITKRLNIGIFEAIIWEAKDSTGNRGFDINYLNPIIFYRPVEFSLGSPDNSLMGLTFKYRFNRTFSLYGQLLLDEFKLSHIRKWDGWWANKQAYQLGLQGWNIAQVNNLNFRSEFNYVRPYTYSHWSTLQCYGHYNQPLAHPLGANFWESVSFINYRYHFWYAEFKFLYAVYGADKNNENYGSNIFLSYDDHPKDLDNFVGQGLRTTLIYRDVSIAYLLNPHTNMRVEAGLSYRTQNDELKDRTNVYVWFGLKTSLFNKYYDF